MKFKHYVYLIQSTVTNRTYIGYSVNPFKRLRQHNGEIVGGAKYTHTGRPWKIICYIVGFPNASTALQFEWKNHHPGKCTSNKKYYGGIHNRLKTMKNILFLANFTSKAMPTNLLKLMVIWHDTTLLQYWKSL
jgi:structure-specific endonuclease subunit SLX1